MSYHKKARAFSRPKAQRVALMRSLLRSLVIHERIVTTEAKARSLRPMIEKYITLAKKKTLSSRRLLLSRCYNDTVTVKKLIEVIGARYQERKGGYTRVLKVEKKAGSGRTLAVIEFV
ncbi:MAG: 50S ribosomal protein L17 [Alphaproteobacteria bacterium]|nr:50S ribosomal protein L17 [Alphaproteobacteria bacterium]